MPVGFSTRAEVREILGAGGTGVQNGLGLAANHVVHRGELGGIMHIPDLLNHRANSSRTGDVSGT